MRLNRMDTTVRRYVVLGRDSKVNSIEVVVLRGTDKRDVYNKLRRAFHVTQTFATVEKHIHELTGDIINYFPIHVYGGCKESFQNLIEITGPHCKDNRKTFNDDEGGGGDDNGS